MPVWDTMSLPVGKAATEVWSPALSAEQQQRLWCAWPRVYLAGLAWGAPEDTWRRELAYDASEWAAVRDRFADAIQQDEDGWFLRFLRGAVQRQQTFAAEQSARSRKRWHPAAQPPHANGIPADAAAIPDDAAASRGNAVESPAVAVTASVEPKSKHLPRGTRRLPVPKSPADSEWHDAFCELLWPRWLALRPGSSQARSYAIWMRLPVRGQDAYDVVDEALSGYERQCKSEGREVRHVKLAETWLNDYAANLELQTRTRPALGLVGKEST